MENSNWQNELVWYLVSSFFHEYIFIWIHFLPKSLINPVGLIGSRVPVELSSAHSFVSASTATPLSQSRGVALVGLALTNEWADDIPEVPYVVTSL